MAEVPEDHVCNKINDLGSQPADVKVAGLILGHGG